MMKNELMNAIGNKLGRVVQNKQDQGSTDAGGQAANEQLCGIG